MYRQLSNSAYRNGIAELAPADLAVAQSGQLDAMVALEDIGVRLNFARNQEIYAEGDGADCWYKVISGAVRICKLLADGRRYIAGFASAAIASVSTAPACAPSPRRQSARQLS